MEEHLQLLELDFKSVANDLDFAACRLDTKMAVRGRDETTVPDVHNLLVRIEELQKEVPLLEESMMDVIRRVKAVESTLSTSAVSTHDSMLRVYSRLGCEPDGDWVAEAKSVKAWMQRTGSSKDGGGGGCGGDRGEGSVVVPGGGGEEEEE
ncbi:unnamed protein product, partial [Choristocarpus tenellus]